MQKRVAMKQTAFTIDSSPGLKLSGFTKNEDWNGLACPYFLFEEGQKIAEAHRILGQKAWFDEANDQFIFETDGEVEFYPAVSESGHKLYTIGNASWIWEESND